MCFHAHVTEQLELRETVALLDAAVGDLNLDAVMVGGDSGVTLADELSDTLGLRTNGTLPEGSRRNKCLQQDRAKAVGLRSVREALCTQWEQIKAFIDSEAFPVVLKPVESCGSEGVKLCFGIQEAQAHFRLLMATQRAVGFESSAVLVQEFLRGKEYVVDHCSRDGVHKTVNLFVYDKRPCNGAPFVYYGMSPLEDSQSEEAQALVSYTRGVLDALGIRNGATHGEVIMTPDGPCLVEMNCRAAGLDGALVQFQRLIYGRSQVDVAVDAFLDAEAFERAPDLPPTPLLAPGYIVTLVAMREGTVLGAPGLERIRRMSSFVSMRSHAAVGERIRLTTDLFSNVGSVLLVNSDPGTLARDVAEIRAMQSEGSLYDLEEGPSESTSAESLHSEGDAPAGPCRRKRADPPPKCEPPRCVSAE